MGAGRRGHDLDGHYWLFNVLPLAPIADGAWILGTLICTGVAIAVQVSGASVEVSDGFIGAAVGLLTGGFIAVAGRKADIESTDRLVTAVEPPRLSLFGVASSLGRDLYAIQTSGYDPQILALVTQSMKGSALRIGGSLPAVLDQEVFNSSDRPDPDVTAARLGTAIENSADFTVRLAFSAGWHAAFMLDGTAKGLGDEIKVTRYPEDLKLELGRLDRLTSMIGERFSFMLSEWRKGTVSDTDIIALLRALLEYLDDLPRIGSSDEAMQKAKMLLSLVRYNRRLAGPRELVLIANFHNAVDSVASAYGVENEVSEYRKILQGSHAKESAS